MTWMIVDGHEDIAMALMENAARDYGGPVPAGAALSLSESKRGGLGLICATIFAPEGYWPQSATEAAEWQMTCYEDLLVRFDRDLFRVESRGDLALCQAGGPIGLVHLMEGADPIRSPRDMRRWAERGVRFVGLAWNTPNRYCGAWDQDSGVSADGRQLLREMRTLRVVPDVSHLTPRAFGDVLDADTDVVVASHSNAHALHPHRRNLTDGQIRRVAERGGLVGVVLYNDFLGASDITLGTVTNHIDHMVQLVGADHVGLGSDLDGGFTTQHAPAGIDTVADLGRIGEALMARGYRDEDIGKILGGNWMRVLRWVLPE